MKTIDQNTQARIEELAVESLEQITGAAGCSPLTVAAGGIIGGALSGGSPWGVGAGAVIACGMFPSRR